MQSRSSPRSSGLRRDPWLSGLSCQSVKVQGVGGGQVIASSFGDVQVADVGDGGDDGGSDGGEVDRSVACAVGGLVFAEAQVTNVVMYFHRPVFADHAGQVGGAGLRGCQAGDHVDGLAGNLPSAGVLPPAGELDGLADVREVDAEAFDVDGLQATGLDPAVPGLSGGGPCPNLLPRQRLDLGVEQGLVLLDDRHVVALLGGDQPVQVGPDGVEGVEGDCQAGQVQAEEQVGEVAGLVVLDVHLDVIQQAAAVLDDAEQVHPCAVAAAGSSRGLAVHGHRP